MAEHMLRDGRKIVRNSRGICDTGCPHISWYHRMLAGDVWEQGLHCEAFDTDLAPDKYGNQRQCRDCRKAESK